MPLVKSPTMTPRKLAANRANGRLSVGHAHLEGEGPRGLITLRAVKRKANPNGLSHLLSTGSMEMAPNKPNDAILFSINGLLEFWASFLKNMFGKVWRSIKEFRSWYSGERAPVARPRLVGG